MSCTGGNSTGNTDPDSNSTNPNQTNSNGGGVYIPATEVVLCANCPIIDEDDECFLTDEEFNASFSVNSPLLQ